MNRSIKTVFDNYKAARAALAGKQTLFTPAEWLELNPPIEPAPEEREAEPPELLALEVEMGIRRRKFQEEQRLLRVFEQREELSRQEINYYEQRQSENPSAAAKHNAAARDLQMQRECTTRAELAAQSSSGAYYAMANHLSRKRALDEYRRDLQAQRVAADRRRTDEHEAFEKRRFAELMV